MRGSTGERHLRTGYLRLDIRRLERLLRVAGSVR